MQNTINTKMQKYKIQNKTKSKNTKYNKKLKFKYEIQQNAKQQISKYNNNTQYLFFKKEQQK